MLLPLFLFLSTTYAQQALPPYVTYDSPFLMPLGAGKPASDLMGSDGKILSEWELEERRRVLWNEKMDLSILSPAKDSTYYQGDQPYQDNFAWPIQNYDEVNFMGFAESETRGLNNGLFRFNLRDQSRNKDYVGHLSEVSYSYLIRAALLRKLGYRVPAMKRFGALKLKFSSLEQKESFLDRMFYVLSDRNLWLVENPAQSPYVLIQDIMLMPFESLQIFNLAIDPFLMERTGGKRIFKSLVVPFNLIPSDDPSINLLPWSVGSEYSANLRLNDERTSQFDAAIEDAKWILTRMSKLSREDWSAIVAESDLPGCHQALLVEKYLARLKTFNHLTRNPQATPEHNEHVNCQDYVYDGKLTVNDWEGYASHFAWGDPENPLNSKEVRAISMMKIIEFAFSNTAGFLSSLPLLRTDVGGRNQIEINKLLTEAIKQTNETKKIVNIPFSTWSFFTAGVNLIASRQVIVGSYQGTTNSLLSLVDNIGIVGEAGIYLGVAGLIPDFKKDQVLGPEAPKYNVIRSPFNAAQAKLALSLSYSHIRPIAKTSDALKQMPFKNFLVPKEKRDLAKTIERLLKIEGDVPPADQEGNENALLKEFKESLIPGESFMVNRRLIANGSLSASFTFNQWLNLGIGYELEDNVIDRIHIVRRDEQTIQVYKNFANLIIPENLTVTLNTIIPLARFRHQTSDINYARTDFYEVVIDPAKNTNWRKEFAGLMAAIKSGRLAKLKSQKSPYRFQFKATEKLTQLSAAIWNWNKVKQGLEIEITYPKGTKESYYRDYRFFMAGSNWLEYAADAADNLITNLLNIGIDFTNYSFNPGTSPSGKATSRVASTEVNQSDLLGSVYAKVSRLNNGFHIKKKKLDKLLLELRDHYHYQFYLPEQFANTKSMSIYHSQLTTHLPPASFQYFLNLDLEGLNWKKSICYQFNNDPELNELNLPRPIDLENPRCDRWQKLKNFQKKLLRALKKNSFKSFAVEAGKLALYLENRFKIFGVIELMGGEEIVYVEGKFTGYRDGVEFNQDKSNEVNVLASTLGVKPNQAFGPLSALMRVPETDYGQSSNNKNINTTEGELFLNWILRRAY